MHTSVLVSDVAASSAIFRTRLSSTRAACPHYKLLGISFRSALLESNGSNDSAFSETDMYERSVVVPWALVAILLANETLASESVLAPQLDAPRVTRSGHGYESERNGKPLRDAGGFVESITVPRLDRQQLEKSRSAVHKDVRTSQLAAASTGDAWFYDASTELFNDLDGDGYYHYLRVKFDVDSYFNEHWVYARLYVSEDGFLWDEYHVTGDFLVNGSAPFDEFEVETELVSGFPTGAYDVLIELYDADYGDFLGEYGPADSSAFSLLPLEDIRFDEPAPVITFSEEHGGGGSIDLLVLSLLLASVLARSISTTHLRRLRIKTPATRSQTRIQHWTDRTL